MGSIVREADIRDAMPERFHRRSIRLRGYDYANEGAYYLTICTYERSHSFGRIADGVMHPSPLGEIVQRCWDGIPEHMPHVDVGEFVVMPNHVHGIVVIRERHPGRDPVGADHDRPNTIPEFVQADHDRPNTMPTTDHDPPPTTPPTDALNDGPNDRTANAPRAPHAPMQPDHDRPNTMSTTDHDPPPTTPPTDALNDGPNDHIANAPHAPMRADHDRPLRPPTDPGARPPTPMPIVPVGSLGRIVRAFKSAVTRAAYHDGLLPHGTRCHPEPAEGWQRNYWDRVIRDDGEYERIAKYICDNPANWKGDRFNR